MKKHFKDVKHNCDIPTDTKRILHPNDNCSSMDETGIFRKLDRKADFTSMNRGKWKKQ